MKKILYLLAFVLGCGVVSLSSCEKKTAAEPSSPATALSGTTWEGNGLGTTISMTFINETQVDITLSGWFGGSINGTYTHEQEKVVVTVVSSSGAVASYCEPGDEIEGIYTGNEITIDIMDQDYTLKKQ